MRGGEIVDLCENMKKRYLNFFKKLRLIERRTRWDRAISEGERNKSIRIKI